MTLPNRIAMAPLTRGRSPDLVANHLMAQYYSQRASGGLIITEGTHISVQGRGWFHAPDIFTSRHATAWKLVTDQVHQAGGRIFCQLWHTGRASHSSFRDGVDGYEGDMLLAVAPSAVKKPSKTGMQSFTNLPGEVPIETPRAFTTSEADLLPADYRNAALMAKEAGFDGVEVHSANGYLLDEFLQSCTNKREDKYGGSIENRYRMLDLVLQAVLEVFEPCQVGVKLSPNGSFNGMASPDYRETFLYVAKQLAKHNLGYLHIMIGQDFGFHDQGEAMTLREFRDVYPGVIMGGVGFTAETANGMIEKGDCDLISFGRPYLSNPDLVERFEKGVKLNDCDYKTFYSSVGNVMTAEGYTDYPTMEEVA